MPVSPDSYGRLCIIEAIGEALPIVAVLEKSNGRGGVDAVTFGRGERKRLTQILRAAPVLAIVMP
jgi:hypothetical protein